MAMVVIPIEPSDAALAEAQRETGGFGGEIVDDEIGGRGRSRIAAGQTLAISSAQTGIGREFDDFASPYPRWGRENWRAERILTRRRARPTPV